MFLCLFMAQAKTSTCLFELDLMCALVPFNYIVIISHCKHNYSNCDLIHAQLPPSTFTKINVMISDQISFENFYKVVNVYTLEKHK